MSLRIGELLEVGENSYTSGVRVLRVRGERVSFTDV